MNKEHEAWSEPPAPLILVGSRWSPRVHDIKDFLARYRVPYRWHDPENPSSNERIARACGLARDASPVILLPDGTEIVDPTDDELAERAGLSTRATSVYYDLAVIGGGPAGLAAAVYGASEGLRTVVIEREAPGGQAAMSARIDNYLGFPDGIEGAELARRAVEQAVRFGAEVLVRTAVAIRVEDPYRIVELDDGAEIVCGAIIIATGVEWRTLDAPGCREIHGAGIYYGAAAAEAAHFRGQDAFVLGGGNSAGQAAMLLARYARSVTLIAMEDSLEENMSRYLLDEIRGAPNVRLRTGSTVVGAAGDGRLERITIRALDSGAEETVDAAGLFVFIGATPRTEWLEGTVRRDDRGFILCGERLHREDRAWPLTRDPFLLETSLPGVFVAGDVRADSVKRVASAVGEGAMAVQFVHTYLAGAAAARDASPVEATHGE
jgi:thioredoxin reductase (NADPH)